MTSDADSTAVRRAQGIGGKISQKSALAHSARKGPALMSDERPGPPSHVRRANRLFAQLACSGRITACAPPPCAQPSRSAAATQTPVAKLSNPCYPPLLPTYLPIFSQRRLSGSRPRERPPAPDGIDDPSAGLPNVAQDRPGSFPLRYDGMRSMLRQRGRELARLATDRGVPILTTSNPSKTSFLTIAHQGKVFWFSRRTMQGWHW